MGYSWQCIGLIKHQKTLLSIYQICFWFKFQFYSFLSTTIKSTFLMLLHDNHLTTTLGLSTFAFFIYRFHHSPLQSSWFIHLLMIDCLPFLSLPSSSSTHLLFSCHIPMLESTCTFCNYLFWLAITSNRPAPLPPPAKLHNHQSHQSSPLSSAQSLLQPTSVSFSS